MIARSFSKIATVACAAIICIGFVGCSGAVSSPATTTGQQPSQPPAGEPPAGAEFSLSAATSDSRPSAGAQFTLSATVRNDGEGTLPAVTLRFYRSTDATITTADTEVGTGAVASLAASGSASDSLELTAPSTPGTYYYGACVDTVADETDTTNNCSTSVQVAVPERERPDLKVAAPTVSDSGPVTGTQFTLSVTVRNDGNGTAAATTLRYYRSTDAAITTADTEVGTEEIARHAARESASDSVERAASAPPSTEVGTDEIAGLAARGSASDSVELAAPTTPGTYYYGACVDAVTDEADTTNNCSTSAQVTVRITVTEPQGDPDLAVTSASVSDSGPAAGAQLTLSATVRNDGEGAAAATTLRYYRSANATITTTDTQVGTAAITQLAAAGSSSQSVDLTAPATPGTYYYGACVDAVTDETDTTNNCSTSVQVTIPEPERPDLKVSALSVSDSDPAAGAQFTLSATVRNDGNGAAAATTLRYYRSSDATITTTDTQVGTDAVAGLAASGSGSESVGLTAPATPGTYYYGACVDAVTDETDTTNNCSTSVQVTIPEPERPDLKVSALSVSDSDPAAGAQFTLSATVRNDGKGAAAATTLRYYRSANATITTTDTQVGTDAVAGLAASGSGSESVGLTAPATPGTYYYGACVDAVTDESDTTNNCSTSVQVTVPAPRPDLVVESASVDDSSPAVGATFTLSATVENDGDGRSAATTLRYYRSADATISTADTEEGNQRVAGLVASVSYIGSVDLTAPSTAGTYYYGACVDAVTDESDTANNCSTSVRVTVPPPEPQQENTPDLVVTSPSVDESSPAAGEWFIVSVTVRNDGNGASAATTLRYYGSTDTTISTADAQINTEAVTALAGSGTASGSLALTAPSTPGTYYYGACVDAVTGESDTANNCSTSVQVTVQPGRPDLVVASPAVDESSPVAGAAFTLSATVRNQGHGASAATTLRYYRSTDATITTADTEEGTDTVAGLAVWVSYAGSVDLTAPSTAGTYYYGACVDAVTDESDTTNNCSTSVQVTVPQPPANNPDLVVESASVDDGSPAAGATFTLSATVENDGDGDSPATTLRYYQSTDATISTSDTEKDTDAVEALAASATSSESVNLTAPSTPGTYYYGACVDAVTYESDTTNNCSTAVQVTVQVTVPQEPPDLVVASPTVDESSPSARALFTLSVTVKNDGDGDSPATTLRYYRSTDATISTADTEEEIDAVDALAASRSSSESANLRAPSTPGTYYYGACVDAVTNESDTTNNCSVAIQVTAVALPDDCAANTSTTCQIRVSGFTSGAIENGGDRDWIRITGQRSDGLLVAGHRYRFRVRGYGTILHGVWIDPLDSPVFEVLDSSGASLSPPVTYTSASGTAAVEFVAGATQVYYVAVSGYASSATGAYSVATTNTTSSTIQQLQFRSDPGADGTYSVNDEITVRVIFSSEVSVTGTPQLALNIGGVTRQASYTGVTGLTADMTLTFSYTVAAGDSDADGIAISANSLTTPTGSSIRADGMNVPLHHDAIPANSGHKVDGSG